ncbi:MAG: hypothetical protein HQ541_03410 [Mariniphaga sp.]|nr:hypothetical protein [Mariniphaga sp.]
MGSWSNEIINLIKANLENVKDRDLRFFRIDEFIRNIERTDSFSEKCPDCLRHKSDILEVIKNIDIAIKVPGKTRREFDCLTGKLSKHMMKEHNFYAPFYYTYLYSFFGIIGGLALGFLGSKLYPSDDWIVLVIGFVIGLITGNFIGINKDRVIRKNKKLM